MNEWRDLKTINARVQSPAPFTRLLGREWKGWARRLLIRPSNRLAATNTKGTMNTGESDAKGGAQNESWIGRLI